MTQINRKGLRLRQAEETGTKTYRWLPKGAVPLVVYWALIHAAVEITGVGEICHSRILAVTGICLCGAYAVLTGLGKRKWFYPGLLAMLLVFVFLFRDGILEGLCLLWNQLSVTYTAGTGWVIPELETGVGGGRGLLPASVLLGSVAAMVSCFFTAKAGLLWAVLMPGLVFAGVAVFGCGVSSHTVILVLLASLTLLLNGGWGSRKPVSVLLSWCMCGAAACAFLAATASPTVRSWAENTSIGFRGLLHDCKYETKYATLPEGDFRSYQEPDPEGMPALVVTMEKPEEMYLRGFVGWTFSENVWRPMDTKILADNKNLLYWLNLEEFNPGAQLEAAASQAEFESNGITIQNIGACSRYLYVPFGLLADSSAGWMRPENLYTETLRADGQRTYRYSAVYNGAQMVPLLLEKLKVAEPETVSRYRRAESAYREFVCENYLQVPQEVTELLGERLDSIAAKYGPVDMLTMDQAQECALTFLSQCFPEAGIPDGLELPLDTARGTDYQYATVAALVFRYYGIPARYAEGYVITQQMAQEAENTSLTVDSSCARAWTEVYQDGIGWLPVEVMPGLQMAGSNHAENGESPAAAEAGGEKDDSNPEKEDKQESDVMEQENPGGTRARVREFFHWSVLVIVLMLLLALLLLTFRRKRILRMRARRYRSGNRSAAIGWIFSDTVALLEQMGISRGNGSVMELPAVVSERFGEEYAGELREMAALNGEAMFSSHVLKREQRKAMLDFREKTVSLLRANLKWSKRLWMKWIRCLY